jgi:hypothetical protein
MPALALLVSLLAAVPPAADAAGSPELAPTVVYLHGETYFDDATDHKQVEGSFRDVGVATTLRGHTVFATGFLVLKDGRTYLVTARHVLDALRTRDIRVTFGGDGNLADLRLTEIATSPAADWTVHGTEDVAVIELDPARVARLATIAIRFADLQRVSPSRLGGSDVLIVGFPRGIGVPPRSFSPVVRSTRVASGEFAHGGRTYIVLDSPSAPGFSGAPVFERGSLPAAHISACAGLVAGTLSDGTGDELAAVVPARLIQETLAMAERREPRGGGDTLRK